MNLSLLLGAVCVLSSVTAQQQYASQGTVPRRSSAFAGATAAESAEPVRTAARQRPAARRIAEDDGSRSSLQQQPQLVRTRGRGVAPKARNIVQDNLDTQFARGRSSDEYENVYVKPRVVAAEPQAISTQLPQTTRLVTPKPVVEEEEDGDYISEEGEDGSSEPPPNSISRSAYVGPYQPGLTAFSPAPGQASRPLQPSFQRPAFLQPTAFRPSPQGPPPPQPLPNSQSLGVVKQQPRPQALPQLRPLPSLPVTRPPPSPTPAYNSLPSSEEEEDDEPQQFVRQPPSRQQPRRPQSAEADTYRPLQKAPQPPRQQQIVRSQDTSRPYPSKASSVQKERKPVAQTVRKYHDENEDGSITWGYENDDGSFKEETIGVDCVTRGKYGYVDPDGVKREYTYQTGIPCDKEAEAEQAASSNEGYIDYTNNKYVFPNGQEIDLDDMVKNRARKPAGKYRY